MADQPAPETPGEPRLVELATLAEQSGAIDTLIGIAQQQIRVFDQDLSQTGWNGATRADRLAAFLRGVRGRRLDIIVHDMRYLQSACPHMINLLRNYGHALTIYQTGPSLPFRAAACGAGHRSARAGAPAGEPLRRDLGHRRSRVKRYRPRPLKPGATGRRTSLPACVPRMQRERGLC